VKRRLFDDHAGDRRALVLRQRRRLGVIGNLGLGFVVRAAPSRCSEKNQDGGEERPAARH
jgi:hypothetical protein